METNFKLKREYNTGLPTDEAQAKLVCYLEDSLCDHHLLLAMLQLIDCYHSVDGKTQKISMCYFEREKRPVKGLNRRYFKDATV